MRKSPTTAHPPSSKRDDKKAVGIASAWAGVLLECMICLPVANNNAPLSVPLAGGVLASIVLPFLYGFGTWLYLPPGLADHQNRILAAFSLLAGLFGLVLGLVAETGTTMHLAICFAVFYGLVWGFYPPPPRQAGLLEVVHRSFLVGMCLAFVAAGCAVAPVLLGNASMGGWVFLWMGCCALALGYAVCLVCDGGETQEDEDEDTPQPGGDYVLLVAETL